MKGQDFTTRLPKNQNQMDLQIFGPPQNFPFFVSFLRGRPLNRTVFFYLHNKKIQADPPTHPPLYLRIRDGKYVHLSTSMLSLSYWISVYSIHSYWIISKRNINDKAIGSKIIYSKKKEEEENSVVFMVYVFFSHFYLRDPFFSTHPPTPIFFLRN